jgi:SprT protein
MRRQQRFEYHCQCQSWPLSTTRHNRIQRGAEYRCRKCGCKLVAGMIQEAI